MRCSGRDAPIIVKLLHRGLRHDKVLYSIVFDHPVDDGRSYPAMMVVLGATRHRTDDFTLDPTCAYVAYINAIEPGWSGTELVRLAIAIAASAGMKRCTVHDAAVARCPDDEKTTFPLSAFLLLLRGITFYGRLGFSPVPEPFVCTPGDAREVRARISESHARARLATAGGLKAFMSALFRLVSSNSTRIEFVKASTAMYGIRHRETIGPKSASDVWSESAPFFRKHVFRALLSGSSDDDRIVDLLDAKCKCRLPFFRFIWFLGEEFNTIVVRGKKDNIVVNWPIHEDFLFLVGHVSTMSLERPIESRTDRG